MVSGWRLLTTLGLWLLTSALAGAATVSAVPSPGLADVTPVVVAEVYALLITALLVAFRNNWPALGLIRCRTADIGLATGACVVAYLVTATLQSVTGPWPWSSSAAILRAMGSDDGRLATASAAGAGLIIVRACLLAALGEEMLFRGVLYSWLRRRLSPRAAIPVSAAAHAAIHGFPAVLPLAFVLGLGFGWVRERSGSVLPTIVVHALHNGALITWAYIAAGWTTRLPAWGAP
jgi:membrane protease YdiL (CAAX protease family)